MSTARRRTTLTLAVMLVIPLSGCASDVERYCAELEEQRSTLSDLAVRAGEPGSDVLGETLAVWRELRDQAPGDVSDEWSTLVFALEGLQEAFEAAGTSPGEYDPASPPSGVTEAEADRLQDAAAELASPRVAAAGEGIQQHARDVCKVDLGVTSGQG